MFLLPSYFLLRQITALVHYCQCPWDNEILPTSQINFSLVGILIYMIIVQVLLPALLTIINCLFFLMSYGWGCTTFDIIHTNREALHDTVKLLAILYLQLFLKSLDYQMIQTFAYCLEGMVYVYQLYKTNKNYKKTIENLNRLLDDEEIPEAHRESAELKKKQSN